MNLDPTVHHTRYQIHAPIGSGSMGTVYRTHDRLTGQDVALKQVVIAPEGAAANDRDDALLQLTHEFSLLASLRHPHIISVLDYGLDAQRQPFFTMELLAQAQGILAASAGLTPEAKLDLLIQACEALAYLHRRSILHHDLKPENVLVADGQVRLLDFGLAVLASQPRADDAFGTLLYLPPEVLSGQPYTTTSDMYSLGVIAYELLLGQHPFPTESVRDFLWQVRHEPPDLTALADQPALAQVLGRLLAKQPADRPSAQGAITLLREVLGSPSTAANAPAIRESYLQAAAFVGREHELAQLSRALEAARAGQGSAWLIGGESGVGKSRLLDELRIQALVAGFQVLRGQAVAEGGSPFQLWRTPVRPLALSIPLSGLEAGVLKEITPDLERLLGQAVPDAPALSGGAQQQRLTTMLVNVLARQPQPTLLLLEDLQWAQESLEPLKQLIPTLGQLPLLVVGSYRSDEQPDLPAALPAGVQLLPLPRLSEQATEQLAESILGDFGQQIHIVAQLQQESEGNVFFLVELLRAWAEEAGGLQHVGTATISRHVLTGGMTAVVRRRLAKVPAAHQPLLLLAAIAGRELDLAVLEQLSSAVPLQAWLLACSEAMVLEVHEQRWRFAHDKLREVLLLDAMPAALAAGHAQAAQAIEAVYSDTGPLALALAEHWRAAGDVANEIRYSVPAGEQLRWVGSYAEAARHIQRTLTEHAAVLPTGTRIQLLKSLGNTYREFHHYTDAVATLRAGLALARSSGDQQGAVDLLNILGWSLWRGLQYAGQFENQAVWAEAQVCFQEAYALAEALGDRRGMAYSLHNQGIVAKYRNHDLPRAFERYQQALALFQAAGDLEGSTGALYDMGIHFAISGDLAQAKAYLHSALAQAQQIGYVSPITFCYDALIITAFTEEDWPAIADYLPSFAPLTANPEHLFYHHYKYYAAALAFHNRAYDQVIEIGAYSLAYRGERYQRVWNLCCLTGAAALLQGEEATFTCYLERACITLPLIGDQSPAYLVLLVAGAGLAAADRRRGGAWLGYYQVLAQTVTDPELRTHLYEVAARIEERFAPVLATPAAQAARAQGAQIAPAQLLAAIAQCMAQGEPSVRRLLEAVEGLGA